jgi:hypothetical protein
MEQAIAGAVGAGWKLRGPAGPDEASKHETWRGQKYRTGSGRWANNGGTRAWWYNVYYPLKRKASESEGDRVRLQQWLQDNPMPEKSTKDDSSSKGTGDVPEKSTKDDSNNYGKSGAAASGAYGGAAASGAYGGAAPSGAYGGAAASSAYGGASSSGAYGGAAPSGAYGGAASSGAYLT